MRTFDQNPSGKAIAAAATTVVTFTNSDIPGNKVIAYCFAILDSAAGTVIDISTLTRITVKANGIPIWQLSLAQLRAYIFRFSRGGYCLPATAITATSAVAQPMQRFTLPFFILDAVSKDAADICQFPPNSLPTIELTFVTAANQGGTIICGWWQTSVAQQCYPKLYASPMTIAASSPNGRSPIVDEGIIEGFGIDTIGLGRVRLVLGGAQIFQANGQLASSATASVANQNSLLWESQQLDCDWSSLATATAGTDSTPNSPMFFDVHVGLNAPPGGSFIELTTLAAWAGVANELCIYSVVGATNPNEESKAA